MREAFSEWISCSAHFAVNPMPLTEGWHHVKAASERQRQWSRTEYIGRPVSNLASSKSDSTPPLVGSSPTAAVRTGQAEDMGCGWATRAHQAACEEGLPSPYQQKSVLETHPLPLQIEEVQIQMDTPL